MTATKVVAAAQPSETASFEQFFDTDAAETAAPDEVADTAADEEEQESPSVWKHQGPWAHDWLEFRGDKLAVRVPNGAAIQALANSRYSSPAFQDRLAHAFFSNHLSEQSQERFAFRSIDPDDGDYNEVETYGELLKALCDLGQGRLEADRKALAAVAK